MSTPVTAPPMPQLADGEVLACVTCLEPIDPVAWPSHPSHDLTDVELDTMRRYDEAAAALAEARRDAQLRAEHKRLARAARANRKKTRR